MGLDSTDLVVASRHQTSAVLCGEAVIMQLEVGRYYGLKGVGARVWELVQETTSVGEIVDRLVDEFDVDTERCRADLCELLRRLEAERLVDIAPAEPSMASEQR